MTLQIEYPPQLPNLLHQTRAEFEQQARIALAVKLFEMKKVPSGIAAAMAGLSRAQFLLRLHEFGVPMIDLTEEELRADLQNA